MDKELQDLIDSLNLPSIPDSELDTDEKIESVENEVELEAEKLDDQKVVEERLKELNSDSFEEGIEKMESGKLNFGIQVNFNKPESNSLIDDYDINNQDEYEDMTLPDYSNEISNFIDNFKSNTPISNDEFKTDIQYQNVDIDENIECMHNDIVKKELTKEEELELRNKTYFKPILSSNDKHFNILDIGELSSEEISKMSDIQLKEYFRNYPMRIDYYGETKEIPFPTEFPKFNEYGELINEETLDYIHFAISGRENNLRQKVYNVLLIERFGPLNKYGIPKQSDKVKSLGKTANQAWFDEFYQWQKEFNVLWNLNDRNKRYGVYDLGWVFAEEENMKLLQKAYDYGILKDYELKLLNELPESDLPFGKKYNVFDYVNLNENEIDTNDYIEYNKWKKWVNETKNMSISELYKDTIKKFDSPGSPSRSLNFATPDTFYNTNIEDSKTEMPEEVNVYKDYNELLNENYGVNLTEDERKILTKQFLKSYLALERERREINKQIRELKKTYNKSGVWVKGCLEQVKDILKEAKKTPYDDEDTALIVSCIDTDLKGEILETFEVIK